MLSTHPEVWITNVLTSSSNRTWLSMLASGLQTVIELSFAFPSSPFHEHVMCARENIAVLHQADPKRWVHETCFLPTCLPSFGFSAYSCNFFFSFSACNIYPKHRSSLLTQGDASFCYPIPVFSVRCAWLIFLARSKSHPWSCLWW